MAPFASRLPFSVTVDDDQEIAVTDDWAREALGRGEGLSVSTIWLGPRNERYTGPHLDLEKWGLVKWAIGDDEAPAPDCVFKLIEGLPVEIAVVGPRFEHRNPNPGPGEWDANREPLIGLGDAHRRLGLGVLLRHHGHDRIVSRRWLENGPWLLRHMADDTTWMQFHADVDAAALTWEQAARAHERFGFSDTGGYFHPEKHLITSQLGGSYKAADRSLTLVRASVPVTQREMLDMCVAWKRGDLNEPIERVRYLFMQERDARRHLHELWLRELECWCIDVQGREVRLDDSYQPERILPEWVEQAEGLPPRTAAPQVRLSLGLASLLDDPEGELPGGWCRDDLLFHIIVLIPQETRSDDYEVREVLGAQLPRAGAREGETGDLVVRARWEVGGALPTDIAAPLLAKARAVPPRLDLPFNAERLGLTLPAIIAPDPYTNQRRFKFKEDHPFNDRVTIHPVSDVLARVRSLNRQDLRAAEALLQLCAQERFVLSAIALPAIGTKTDPPSNARPKGEQPLAESHPSNAKAQPAGDATFFEETTWDMTPDEIAARYSVKFRMADGFTEIADLRHTIEGVPVLTSFEFWKGSLSSIKISVRRTYAAWGEGDQDEMAIVRWISARAGNYTERDSPSITWLLPTAKIWTYCDENLCVYFEPQPS